MAAEPTYLFCLGATKAGTSWLHRHLAAHPECHFRTIKELHYFDRVEDGSLAHAARTAAAEIERLSARLDRVTAEAAGHLRRRIRDLKDWLKVLGRKAPDFGAYRAYLTGGIGQRRVVGDVTPAYALLPEARLADMAAMAPDVRFVYLMRDPVARLWSHARMQARRSAAEEDYEKESRRIMRRVIEGDAAPEIDGIARRGDYAAILAKFDRAIPGQRLLTMFMENLLTPAGLERLWSFLGIGPHKAAFDSPAYEGRALDLPEGLASRARQFLAGQYRAVAERFPDLPDAWRRNMAGAAA